MKRKSSSQEQIISAHKEHQAGASVPPEFDSSLLISVVFAR